MDSTMTAPHKSVKTGSPATLLLRVIGDGKWPIGGSERCVANSWNSCAETCQTWLVFDL